MAKTIVHDELTAKWGGKDHLEVAKERSFASMIFEMLSEKEPSEGELKVFELLLNLSIDHGPDAPSSKATIAAARGGKGMGKSVGAGISEINEHHGGAIEPCMKNFISIKNQELNIKGLVEKTLETGERLAGFGHRIYKDKDPRTQLIFRVLEEHTMGGEYIQIAKGIEAQLELQKGQKLPINIDGGIAVALCSFGWDPKLANAVFIIARTPGLTAHYINNS